MGLSSSKSKTKNDPWKPAQPYILKGLQQSSQVFDQQQPDLNKYGAMQRDTYGRLAPGAEKGIMGAQGVVNDELSGKNLNGNPYLDKLLAATRGDTTDAVNAQFESGGRYGSGMHAAILAREIAKAEDQARYANYANERANQVGAVGQASGLMAGSQSLLNNAAELPWIGVGALNGNVRQASNGYGTQTTTTTPNFGQMYLQAAAQAAQAAAMASDRRLKDNIVKVGEAGALNLYEWNYRHDMGVDLPEGRFRGVMADEVAQIAPWLLGPEINGFKTVYYTPERVG